VSRLQKRVADTHLRDYDKTLFTEGSKIFILNSATKVQQLLRGYLARKQLFEQLIEAGYTAASASFKNRIIDYRLSKIVGKVRGYVQKKSKAIKEAFDKADEMMKNHSNLMEAYEKNVQKILQQRQTRASKSTHRQVQMQLDVIAEETARLPAAKHDEEYRAKWSSAYEAAKERIKDKCSICLADLETGGKALMVTSFCHVFHAVCLTSFECFTEVVPHKCPNCRKAYEKTPLLGKLH